MVTMTTTVLIATMAITTAAPIVIVRFSLQDKLGMARFFQETFWVVLEMSFLTLGSKTKRVELFDPKKPVAVALGAYD